MNDLTVNQLKSLVKEAAVDALNSEGGQNAIGRVLLSETGQTAVVKALGSQEGQQAIVGALNSDGGQGAFLKVLKSKEAKEIFVDNFAEAFHEVVVPVLENHEKRIDKLEKSLNVVL